MRAIILAFAILLSANNAFAQSQILDYADPGKWRCSISGDTTSLSIKGSEDVLVYDRYVPVVTPDHPIYVIIIYRPIEKSVRKKEERESIQAAKRNPWIMVYFVAQSLEDESIYIFEQTGNSSSDYPGGWNVVGAAISFDEAMKFLGEKYRIE